jgi:transcriptional regulator with XRE-family HTH domain
MPSLDLDDAAGFGAAVRAARTRLGLTQAELADLIGSSQSSVTSWENGRAAPDRASLVWSLERDLRVRPGALSRLLGFLPLSAEADRTPPSVEEAVLCDPRLDELGREIMLATYLTVIRACSPSTAVTLAWRLEPPPYIRHEAAGRVQRDARFW